MEKFDYPFKQVTGGRSKFPLKKSGQSGNCGHLFSLSSCTTGTLLPAAKKQSKFEQKTQQMSGNIMYVSRPRQLNRECQ